jgi:hypothetical protein
MAIQGAREATRTLVPFTLLNPNSQLPQPFTKSPPITVPPAQADIVNERELTQAESVRNREDSEGRHTLVDLVQRLRQRVAYLKGRPPGERASERRLRRTSTPTLTEDRLGVEGILDAPPTYEP